MNSTQNSSNLSLVTPSVLPSRLPAVSEFATGRVYGLRDSDNAPLIIKLPNGIHFACEMSQNQRKSTMISTAFGLKVAFYHQGFKRNGQPIKPVFKGLIIDGEVITHG